MNYNSTSVQIMSNHRKVFITTTPEELEKLKLSRIPENTQKKTMWVWKMFEEWRNNWRVRLDDTLKVLKEPNEFTKFDLNECLQYFVAEMRKCDGEMYPPETQKGIIASIQHHFRNNFGKNWSIFLDPEFEETRKTLDAMMKLSAREGNVKPKKRARSIEFEEESELWKNGSFGSSNGQQLLDTLIYYFGLHLSLRACQEHRNLEYGLNSQLSIKSTPEGEEFIEYVERCSKNKSFGLKKCHMEPKVTRIFENSEEPSRCVVRLYKTYINHRPETHGKPGHSSFYLTPIKNPQGPIWYKASPLGVHSIETCVKRIMTPLKPDGFISNTSVRRTAKNRMMSYGIPKEVIEKKTGRISQRADMAYVEEHTFEKKCIWH